MDYEDNVWIETSDLGKPVFARMGAAQMSKFNGFKPSEMGDKWLVCSEGDVKEEEVVTVNFFRSRTGHKYASMEVVVGKEGEGGKVKGLVWESSEEVGKG